MITILSPAKSLNFKSKTQTNKYSIPEYLDQSEILIKELRSYSPKDLKSLMKISDALGELNFIRYQNWIPDHNLDNSRQAAFAFNGEAYNGLDALNFSQQDLHFAQDNLRILSGLYGILRPLDLIQPYRLEMGIKLIVNGFKDLYSFWGDQITKSLKKELSIHEHPYIVNLASNEYSKSTKLENFKSKVITPLFKEYRNNQYKTIVVYAKKARGMMARFIIENKLQAPEDLKHFDMSGYGYSEELSTENEWIFTR